MSPYPTLTVIGGSFYYQYQGSWADVKDVISAIYNPQFDSMSYRE